MKISREDVEPRQVRLTIEVAPERLAATLATVTQELSKRYRIPGFRPGKAPLDRVAALVGEASLHQEALERLGKEVVGAALRKEKLESVAPVSLELLGTEPPRFGAMVSLEPEVDLGDYRALRIPQPEPPVLGEDAVDEALARARHSLADSHPVDRPAELGDRLLLAVVARIRRAGDPPQSEEEAALPADAPGQLLLLDEDLGPQDAPPGLIKALVGLSAGSSGSLKLPLGSDENAAAGDDGAYVDVHYRIDEVQELDLPPLDDQLAARMGSGDLGLESLREAVRQSLAKDLARQSRDLWVRDAVEALVAGASVSYPPAMLQEELREHVTKFRRYLEQEGEDWEAWLASRSEEELLQQFERQAAESLRRQLVLRRFAEAEGLEFDEGGVGSRMLEAEQKGRRRPRRVMEGVRNMMLNMLNDAFNRRIQDRLLAITAGEVGAGGSPETAAETGPSSATADQEPA